MTCSCRRPHRRPCRRSDAATAALCSELLEQVAGAWWGIDDATAGRILRGES